jgi:hypothetical protein
MKANLLSVLICVHLRQKFIISHLLCVVCDLLAIGLEFTRGMGPLPARLWRGHTLRQGRFFDHALRTVKDYWETVEYNHLNPVRRGLVKHPEQWGWSSYSEYAGLDGVEQERQCGLKIDRVRLPGHQCARI